jgi:DNA-directed RNA polymerase specialized sigma24 family protein
VPEGTVKSRLFLARKQLKERLSWMVTSTKG